MKLKRGWTFQQGNDPKHTANETKEWFRKKRVDIPEWPSQSPDMNSIANLCRESKLNVQKRGPKNITELIDTCIEEWNRIPPESFRRLVVHYSKRLEALINNRGYATKY